MRGQVARSAAETSKGAMRQREIGSGCPAGVVLSHENRELPAGRDLGWGGPAKGAGKVYERVNKASSNNQCSSEGDER